MTQTESEKASIKLYLHKDYTRIYVNSVGKDTDKMKLAHG